MTSRSIERSLAIKRSFPVRTALDQSMADTGPSFDARSEPVSVVVVDDGMGAAWDAFVSSHEKGSFYHLFAWKGVNEEVLGHECHYLAARTADGAVQGALPLVFVKSRIFGRILCSMPFMNFGGPIAVTPSVSRLLAERATALARELNADYLELRCTAPLETELPVSLRKVSLTVQLTADPETLYESFSRKHRKNIRSAQKNGPRGACRRRGAAARFFRRARAVGRSLGTPLYSVDYFERILTVFPNRTDIFICQQRGLPIGAAFTAHFNGTVEGMWAGGRPEMRHLDGNYVLYWEMLRHACAAGHKRSTSGDPRPTRARSSSRRNGTPRPSSSTGTSRARAAERCRSSTWTIPSTGSRSPRGSACRCGSRERWGRGWLA